MNRKRKNRRFFTLIEVTLAMGVTAVGVIGVMAILPYALKTTVETTRETYLSTAANLFFAAIDKSVQDVKTEKGSTGADLLPPADRRNHFKKTLMKDAESLNGKIKNCLTDVDASAGFKIEMVQHRAVVENASAGNEFSWVFGELKFYNHNDDVANGIPAFRALYFIMLEDIKPGEFVCFFKTETRPGWVQNDDGSMTYTETQVLIPQQVSEPGGYPEQTNDEKGCWKRVYVEFVWPANNALINQISKSATISKSSIDTQIKNGFSSRFFVKEYIYTD